MDDIQIVAGHIEFQPSEELQNIQQQLSHQREHESPSQDSPILINIEEIRARVESQKEEEKLQNFLSSRYASLTTTVLVTFILSTSCYIKSSQTFHALKEIKSEFPQVYYFINLNMFLYGLKNHYNFFSILRTDRKNLRKTQIIGLVLFLLGQMLTVQGMSCLWSGRMHQLIDENRGGYGPYGQVLTGFYNDLYRVANSMIWLRLWVIILLVPLLMISLVIFLICSCIGKKEWLVKCYKEFWHKPSLESIILSKTRDYDPVKEMAIQDCCICLENFEKSLKRKIVELKCDHRHIYHLDCCLLWVQKSKVCPICRENIQ